MKQLICYLYENKSNKQVRNVGFIKCIFLQGKVTFQIHGKGMMCNRTMGLEMFLFTGKPKGCEVRRIGIVEGNQGMVNYRVVLDDEGEELSEEYDGVILKAQNDTIYAGTWNHKEYDFTGDWIEKDEHDGNHMDVEQYEDSDKHDENPTVDMVLSKQEPETEEQAQCIKEMVKCTTEQHEEVVIKEEVEEEIMESVVDSCDTDVYQENSDKGDSDEDKPDEDEITYQKLDRQDIAKFPQREWKLANNNFLIHGYMNFKHIMCIREADRTYIGVPGVYYQREAEMARTFGFPTFHRPELSQLNLDESECSRGEDFGYWCRAISVRKDIE